MRRNAVNTGRNSTVGSASSGGRRSPAASESAAVRRLPIGRANWRAAIPLNHSAATAPTTVAKSTNTLKSSRPSPSVTSSGPAGAAMTRSGRPGRSIDRKPKSTVAEPMDNARLTDSSSPITRSRSTSSLRNRPTGASDVSNGSLASRSSPAENETNGVLRRLLSCSSHAESGPTGVTSRSVSRTSTSWPPSASLARR